MTIVLAFVIHFAVNPPKEYDYDKLKELVTASNDNIDDTSNDLSANHTAGASSENTDSATDELTVSSESKDTTSDETTSMSTDDAENVKEEAVKKDSITLVMVGDILLHTPVEKAALQQDGTYAYEPIFQHVKEDISAADLALVNQEVIIGGEELGISGYPAFNTSFSLGDALVDAGFDVVCHGTNHALDKGKKGLLNCLNFWEENHPEIGVLGIHDTKESSEEIFIYEQDGFKIAILNFTYSTNGVPMPEGMPFAVDMLDEAHVVSSIQKAEELADFTIVCPHWGTEYQLSQSKSQEKWAQIFAANGVDLVLGTHPHVIQPIEWVTDEATGHEMLVYYSLGNFVNWTSESGTGIANRMVGGMSQVTLTREVDEQDNKVVIEEYNIVPVVCHLEQGVNGVTVYKLEDYTEELAAANQISKQDGAFSLEYCEELCDRVWSEFAGE